MSVFDLLQGSAYAVERYISMVGMGIYGDKVIGHGFDIGKNPVYHYFIVGATLSHHLYEDYTVECTERVVRYGYEATFRKVVEPLFVVYVASNVQIVDDGVDKVYAP